VVLNDISEGFESRCSYCIYKRRHELLSVRAINISLVAWGDKYVDQEESLEIVPLHSNEVCKFDLVALSEIWQQTVVTPILLSFSQVLFYPHSVLATLIT
jgi:hypothetical protein